MLRMKQHAASNPDEVKMLMQQTPPLCYAMLQAMLRLGMITDAVVRAAPPAATLGRTPTRSLPPQAKGVLAQHRPGAGAPPVPMAPAGGPVLPPPDARAAVGHVLPPPPTQPGPAYHGHPPAAPAGYAAPAPGYAGAPPTAAAVAGAGPEANPALLQQLLSLSEDDLARLPAEQQQQLRALRATVISQLEQKRRAAQQQGR